MSGYNFTNKLSLEIAKVLQKIKAIELKCTSSKKDTKNEFVAALVKLTNGHNVVQGCKVKLAASNIASK